MYLLTRCNPYHTQPCRRDDMKSAFKLPRPGIRLSSRDTAVGVEHVAAGYDSQKVCVG
jgi:hypothetical protein